MKYDVSTSSNGDKRTVDIELLSSIGTLAITMEYDDAETLRDMLTDALEHIDECDRARRRAEIITAVTEPPGWHLYLQRALERRNR